VASARVDWLLPKVAAELELVIVDELGGGEFGAALVRDRDGRELVLKALPEETWAPQFARAAELAALVRCDDYPVPRYHGTGVAAGGAWSLQEHLPGDIPEVMGDVHARQLVGFLRHHVSAADRPGDVLARMRLELGNALTTVADHDATASIGRDLARVLTTEPNDMIRRGDVVHGDYHHRNYLAIGDRITAVFDWELAWAGDWRIDLVTLACWSSWVPWQIPPAVSAGLRDDAAAACEPPVLAFFAAFHTVKAVDFNIRVHPDRITWLLDAIDETTRVWLG
jgi:aminoglycoside phosphotransferase (APT) family kinase protein